MRYFAKVEGKEYECVLEGSNGTLSVVVEGKRFSVDLRHIPRSHTWSVLLDGRSYEFTVHEHEDALELAGGAGVFHVSVEDARTHAARAQTVGARGAQGPRIVKAVMPGIVREVLVAPGHAVEKGQPLVILEAMKMQNEVRAAEPGKIRAVFVAKSDTVEKGARLVEIE
ncbi:MAG TPA: biotin/lipoyl-containing protein [Planctomycetota bacterium]|nr:biotin/lipoyl-containing protein [Planctomycetota bacterium]